METRFNSLLFPTAYASTAESDLFLEGDLASFAVLRLAHLIRQNMWEIISEFSDEPSIHCVQDLPLVNIRWLAVIHRRFCPETR